MEACASCVVVVKSHCSGPSRNFAYDIADTYVRWRLSAYIDVQGDDADELDDRIDEFNTWHRKNELPKYVKLANEAVRRFGDGVSRQDMIWGYDSVRAQSRESLRKAAELLAPLLDRLTPEQIRYMEHGIAEENRRLLDELLGGSE